MGNRQATTADADHLRHAAFILAARARRPRSILLAVFLRVLTDTATKIENEVRNDGPGRPGG